MTHSDRASARSVRRSRSVGAIALVISMLTVAATLAIPVSAATPVPIGVRAGRQSIAVSYETWLGREVQHVTDFIELGTWDLMRQSAGWASSKWGGSRFSATYSVGMFPATGGTFAAGAAGQYDDYWRAIAERFAANDPDAIIRLGWEANGDWFSWSFTSDPIGYRNYFRRIVDVMRSVPGQQFKFEWGLSLRQPRTDESAYPGDAYVDFVGLSVYDGSWGPTQADPVARWDLYLTYGTGLNWLEEFASRHGKKMAFGEWALSTEHIAGVDPDNTHFIERFFRWMEARASRIAYANYFERSNHQGIFALSPDNTPFPKSAALYRSLVGGSPAVAPTTTTSTTTTTTTRPAVQTTTTTTTTKPPVLTTTTRAPARNDAPTRSTPSRTTPTTTKPPTTTTVTSAPRGTTSTSVPPSDTPAVPECPPLSNMGVATSATGYWLLHRDGTVTTHGRVPHLGDLSTLSVEDHAVAIESTPSGQGYWILAGSGAVYTFGDAEFAGDLSSVKLDAPAIALTASRSSGYWITAADGGVFAFGVPFFGSVAHLDLVEPVVNIADTPSGQGYWLVASDGGVFAFGDAAFAGSTGGWELDAPIISMASTPDGSGYLLYGKDGGVFAFGAPFHGSVRTYAGCGNPDAVELVATPTGNGYWVATAEGRVFGFGDAPHLGNSTREEPVVGMAIG